MPVTIIPSTLPPQRRRQRPAEERRQLELELPLERPRAEDSGEFLCPTGDSDDRGISVIDFFV